MSAPNIVYRKTAAGLAEMQARRLRLPRKTFSLLLAVDGQRSREQLCTSLSAFGDVAAQLEMLEEMGLIEDSDTRASGAFSFASPLQKRRDEGAGARFDAGHPGNHSHSGHSGPTAAGEPSFVAGPGQDRSPDAGAPAPSRPTVPLAMAGDEADPLPGAAPRPPDADFDPESTITWAVTDAGPITAMRSTLTLTGMPPVGADGFAELDTWSGTEARGDVAPTWPKSSHEVSADPAFGSAASTPASGPAGRRRADVPAAAMPTHLPSPAPGPQPMVPLPTLSDLPDLPTLHAGQSALAPSHVPTVTPLPPWSMPVPAPQAEPAQPQHPPPVDRSRTYPADLNLIDIRAYIGIGSQRVDPLANVREAMAHVLARNIDLQNYELLHAIESMQSRDELMRLLPYYLVDLDRRLAPVDYRLHVEDLSRLSGLATDALLALMTQRKAGETPG